MYAQGWERKRKYMESEEGQSGEEVVALQANGCPLYTVSPFKYLGRVITEADDD